ncbi:hypothetical protein HMPREF1544_09325 [Mucor circinelloides 1006PhL]|uniref:CCHC-type domain-containing protein n=1 Tax=Mucor circinelloides f. circinelloides (strain 1006PhL) TaxID=1220926 RepID=S2JVT7_MUCC1|nr:hypothetical protein HMPREF1544_09325 [Mucor circinelloides 1006PhL]
MANIPRTRANSIDPATARSPTPPPLDRPWSVVTAGKGKSRGKKHQLISFTPTFVQPRSSGTESHQALNGQAPPAPVELVVPYIKEIEKGSAFIDITHVKNHNLLREALDAFNKDADTDGRGYNEFLGRCEKNRTYLNHVFMETLWAHNTASYNTIVNEGIMLSDNTFIKGFPSYSADSSIVRLTLSGLPFLQLPLLKAALKSWLTRFGEVLDYGLSKKDGYYVGGGYATIAIPTGKPCSQDPCPMDHDHFVPLQREVSWEEDDGDLRKILLTWDAMPDYCRCCGSSDHCRADCPDRLSWLKCFNCNQPGHEWKHCPRNNDAIGTEAPSKTRAVPAEIKKNSRKIPLKVNNSTTLPMIVDKNPTPQLVAPTSPVAAAAEDDHNADVVPDGSSATASAKADTRAPDSAEGTGNLFLHDNENTGVEGDTPMDDAELSFNQQTKIRSQSPEL